MKIHHNKKLFWTIIVLLILLIFVMILIRYQEVKKKLTDVECMKDSDCVKRQTTCCPCSSGGKEECRSKNRVDEPLICPPGNEIVCPQSYNCRETSCSCINNKCVEQ